MRRMLVAFAVSAGVLVLPSSANAQVELLEFQSAVDAMQAVDPTLDPPPNDGRHDFVVGGFQFADLNWAVSAHSGPLGEEPFGHANRTFPKRLPSDGKQERWRVTCLAVVGKNAALNLEPSPAGSNDQSSPHILSVFDGGPGGTLDRFTVFTNFGNEPCTARVFAATLFGEVIQRGNILVHDAMP
jgi:hypothetical protein